MMSGRQRLIQLLLVGAMFFGLLIGVYLIVWKRFSKPVPVATVVKRAVDTRSDDALKYWTADRMRNAKAADMPHVDDLKQEKRRRPSV